LSVFDFWTLSFNCVESGQLAALQVYNWVAYDDPAATEHQTMIKVPAAYWVAYKRITAQEFHIILCRFSVTRD
jgi:hypothetical protein